MDWVPKERDESFGIIIFKKGVEPREVLLVKTDHWGFPKGHSEEMEDGLSAALREVKEETGLSTEVADVSRTFAEEYEIRRERFTTKKTVTYWVGEADGAPAPKEGEIAEVRWVPVKEAFELLTHESAKNILQLLV